MTTATKDPTLTTRQMAKWIGVSMDYVQGELLNGEMPYENVSRNPTRKQYRVRFSDFVAYLRKWNYKRLPSLDEFFDAATVHPPHTRSGAGRSVRRRLSTRQMAGWMGVSQDYIYGEIKASLIVVTDVSTNPARREYRATLSAFTAYLKHHRGYSRLPVAEEFS